DAIIEKRRALLNQGAEAPRDLLSLLMAAKDPENGRAIAEADVRANIVTFINAGHETTANALTWSLFLLSQSPEWRERAEADADQAFDADGTVALQRCEILRAVFEEALRLYPPAAMLARQAIADDELGGVKIPEGTVVTVSPYVLHRRRGLWDNPDAFDPRDSWGNGAIESTVSPTSRSARGRACVSAWPSRCRRGSFCSRIFCALFVLSWSRARKLCPSSA
ncbi:MAG TPA: cytochrome P450, partial [Candidatus Methylacidiphilales bacterium]